MTDIKQVINERIVYLNEKGLNVSNKQLAKVIGMTEMGMSRFLKKKGGNINTIQKLIDYLGLEIVPKKNFKIEL